VVLSACETGLGRLAGGEGVIGLTRAFLYAGASRVLVSLWPVSDASTADLMVRFYDELLAGTLPAEALRRAKLNLLRQNLEYAKPYYWSAFVLNGG
jgi:CHAT domain-containing protein